MPPSGRLPQVAVLLVTQVEAVNVPAGTSSSGRDERTTYLNLGVELDRQRQRRRHPEPPDGHVFQAKTRPNQTASLRG